MQGSCITQKSINKNNTDVLVNMNLGYMKMLEFTKENAIRWIYHARRETEKAIPKIKKKLQELQEKMDKE
jgi:prefoldin subunit 5